MASILDLTAARCRQCQEILRRNQLHVVAGVTGSAELVLLRRVGKSARGDGGGAHGPETDTGGGPRVHGQTFGHARCGGDCNCDAHLHPKRHRFVSTFDEESIERAIVAAVTAYDGPDQSADEQYAAEREAEGLTVDEAEEFVVYPQEGDAVVVEDHHSPATMDQAFARIYEAFAPLRSQVEIALARAQGIAEPIPEDRDRESGNACTLTGPPIVEEELPEDFTTATRPRDKRPPYQRPSEHGALNAWCEFLEHPDREPRQITAYERRRNAISAGLDLTLIVDDEGLWEESAAPEGWTRKKEMAWRRQLVAAERDELAVVRIDQYPEVGTARWRTVGRQWKRVEDEKTKKARPAPPGSKASPGSTYLGYGFRWYGPGRSREMEYKGTFFAGRFWHPIPDESVPPHIQRLAGDYRGHFDGISTVPRFKRRTRTWHDINIYEDGGRMTRWGLRHHLHHGYRRALPEYARLKSSRAVWEATLVNWGEADAYDRSVAAYLTEAPTWWWRGPLFDHLFRFILILRDSRRSSARAGNPERHGVETPRKLTPAEAHARVEWLLATRQRGSLAATPYEPDFEAACIGGRPSTPTCEFCGWRMVKRPAHRWAREWVREYLKRRAA